MFVGFRGEGAFGVERGAVIVEFGCAEGALIVEVRRGRGALIVELKGALFVELDREGLQLRR